MPVEFFPFTENMHCVSFMAIAVSAIFRFTATAYLFGIIKKSLKIPK